jgi:hypothetical protein
MDGGEDTVLTATLHAAGRYCFAPDAVVTHLNRTRWRDVLRHQREYGRFTADIARRSTYKWRPLVHYPVLAPLAGVGRLVSVLARAVAGARPGLLITIRAAPLLVVAIGAWTIGLLEGSRSVRSRRLSQTPGRR